MTELLNEVRVAMPGVQVLFGFLLAVPVPAALSAESTTFQRDVYLFTLLAAAGGHGVPHRARPPFTACCSSEAPEGAHHPDSGTRQFICGVLAALALAMIGAVLLVTDVLFGADGDRRGHRA